MLVKTILQISSTLVSSSGCVRETQQNNQTENVHLSKVDGIQIMMQNVMKRRYDFPTMLPDCQHAWDTTARKVARTQHLCHLLLFTRRLSCKCQTLDCRFIHFRLTVVVQRVPISRAIKNDWSSYGLVASGDKRKNGKRKRQRHHNQAYFLNCLLWDVYTLTCFQRAWMCVVHDMDHKLLLMPQISNSHVSRQKK